MNDQTADRQGLAEAIRAKYDEHPPSRYPTEHALADHLLASPQFARIIAEAEARAWEVGYEAGATLANDGGEVSPEANPHRAALAEPENEGLT